MQQQANEIVKILKSKGLRVTPQRFAVYAYLRSCKTHPTAEQILTALNQDRPISSQATIYSTLQALREVNLVREVLLEEGVSRYDANMERHHHFHCRQCGAIEDLAWDTFEYIDLNKLQPKFQAQSYEINVQGLCDRCQS